MANRNWYERWEAEQAEMERLEQEALAILETDSDIKELVVEPDGWDTAFSAAYQQALERGNGNG